MSIFFCSLPPSGFYYRDKIVNKIYLNENLIWVKNSGDSDDVNYLTFTSSGNSSVLCKKDEYTNTTNQISLEYAIDDGSFSSYTLGDTINLTDGQKVKMRATESNDSMFGYRFKMTGSISASGNIQTLLDKTGQRMDVPSDCYSGLFYGCSSLTQAPELPATVLSYSCYFQMFSYTGITKAPYLPATTLVNQCYCRMFEGCRNLNEAYDIPVTNFTGGNSMRYMFAYTNLQTIPKFEVELIDAGNCYGMFQGCNNLSDGRLYQQYLTSDCYNSMFQGCYSLVYIQLDLQPNFDQHLPYNAMMNMFKDCYTLQNIYLPYLNYDDAKRLFNDSNNNTAMFDGVDINNITVYLNNNSETYPLSEFLVSELKYLKFTNPNSDDEYDGQYGTAYFQLQSYGSPNSIQLEYSTDGSYWQTFQTDAGYEINPGEYIMIRCMEYTSNDRIATDTDNYYKFVTDHRLKVEGNIKYLISQDDGYNTVHIPYCFCKLFEGFNFHYNSKITIPNPVDTYGYGIYQCYNGLFKDSNINTIELEPDFISWTSPNGEYLTEDWVYNVPQYNGYTNSSGKFYCNSNLPIERGNSYIPDGWEIQYTDNI